MADPGWTEYAGASILTSAAAVNAANIVAMDGFLYTYGEDTKIDWRAIHARAQTRDRSVGPYGGAYWVDGRPLSNLAFVGARQRESIAASSGVPAHLLEIMSADADARVIARLIENPSTPDEVREVLRANPLSRVSAGRRADSHGRLVGIAAGATLVVLTILGFASGYTVEIVDQQAHAATFSEVATGEYNLFASGDQICTGGEDYLSCVNSHVAVYNSSCSGRELTLAASSLCVELSAFIDDTKARYDGCGYGCTTVAGADGRWGWAYLDAVPVTVMQPNNDARQRITHDERCVFDLGPIEIGTCTK